MTTRQVSCHLEDNYHTCALKVPPFCSNYTVIIWSSPCYLVVPTEDESEISFEPGDIIRDVETVDKAWWRGWSKDGRQGLFPANYVETI